MFWEDPFRIALIVVMVATMMVGLYHRFQAAASGEAISHAEEGYSFALALRLTGLVVWIGIAGYLFFPPWFAWGEMPLPDWLRWAGVGLGALGFVCGTWTLTSLGKNLTDTVVTRTDATLITHGPYRWVRHPFYSTAAMLLIAITLISASWFIGASGLVVLALLVIRTSKEEEMLIEKFGQAYRDYMTTTAVHTWGVVSPVAFRNERTALAAGEMRASSDTENGLSGEPESRKNILRQFAGG